MPTTRASGIVLAGGRSTRYGDDKLRVVVDGRPLLAWAVDAVAAVCDDIVIVTAQGGAPTGSFPASARTVTDGVPFGGPLAGLSSGARAALHPLLLVAGGDMPWMRPAILHRLLVGLEPPRDACVLGVGSETRMQPLPMAVRRQTILDRFAEPSSAVGESLRSFLGTIDVSVVSEDDWHALDPDGTTLVDVDSPGDLLTFR